MNQNLLFYFFLITNEEGKVITLDRVHSNYKLVK